MRKAPIIFLVARKYVTEKSSVLHGGFLVSILHEYISTEANRKLNKEILQFQLIARSNKAEKCH